MDPESPRTHAIPARLTAAQSVVRSEPRVAALNDWVAAEVAARGLPIPWFDPGDAGVAARVLFLASTPGALGTTDRSAGVSVDADDDAAAELWELRRAAGLVDGCLHWSAVPFYVRGTVNPADERRAEPLLAALLPLLPRLEVVVPMGRVAQRMWARHSLQQPHGLVTIPGDPDLRTAVERAALLVGASRPAQHRAPVAPAPPVPETAAVPTANGHLDDGAGDGTVPFPRLREAIAKIADRAMPS